MTNLQLPSNLQDKIFEMKFDSDNKVSKIVSYFPFSTQERQEIIVLLGNNSFTGFSSIFSDSITDDEWNKTKVQIKKKFQDDLFDID